MFAALDVEELFKLLVLFLMLILPGLKGLFDKKSESRKPERRRRVPSTGAGDGADDDPFERLLRGEEVVVREPVVVEESAPPPPKPRPPRPKRPRTASEQPSPSAVPLPTEALSEPGAARGGLSELETSLPGLGLPLASAEEPEARGLDRGGLADLGGLRTSSSEVDPFALSRAEVRARTGDGRGRLLPAGPGEREDPRPISVAATDWRRAVVLAEVLGAPAALREPTDTPRF